MTLWDTKKGVSEGFLNSPMLPALPEEDESPSGNNKKEGFSSYLDHNAQATGDLKSSLGTITKSCKQDAEERRLWNEKKQRKQNIARNLLGGRLELCGRVPVPVNYNNELIHTPHELRSIPVLKNDENFAFGGLMRCGSVWGCPDCASIISEFRRKELQEAHAAALAKGLSVMMMTLTVPHYAKDHLKDVLNGISHTLRTFKNRKHYKIMSKMLGIKGDIRALEVTYGKNGWHPHFHIMLFTEKSFTDESLSILKKSLLSQWQAACTSSGLSSPNEHGLDLVNGEWAARYMTKWGIEEEMTKGHLKQGMKEGHVSPFGLLEICAGGDSDDHDLKIKAGWKFKEYAREFKGKRQLVWSKGLRDLLGVGKQIDDDKVIEEVEKKSEVFMTISYEDFKLILNHNKQAECLYVCRLGEEAVRAWLRNLRQKSISFP
ncbi:MAG: protein rep [Bacteroidota bacterium]|nr:protein rep [Bacteroidota bacterium]